MIIPLRHVPVLPFHIAEIAYAVIAVYDAITLESSYLHVLRLGIRIQLASGVWLASLACCAVDVLFTHDHSLAS